MTASTRQETAKIYLFPTRPRMGSSLGRDETRLSSRETQPLPPIDVDGAWYHQAAIRDMADPRKR
ncbi:DUF2735 domain-containing protein [Labrys sp. KNU-23]|uniref:DUF2735 domain-containing protein n=1 Tax=Labrys sp. KNU-23 TaxID=2789216 RepID=UPI0011ECF0E4|nr:DUF2735 domain-containing protein [Labrys sp. KNU-23]QEN88043.1 DUF2735 domain-containing protein [Labrys sp. KNU-23]